MLLRINLIHAFNQRTDAIDAAGSLLKARRVPWEVVMDDLVTIEVKVNTFRTNRGAHKDVG